MLITLWNCQDILHGQLPTCGDLISPTLPTYICNINKTAHHSFHCQFNMKILIILWHIFSCHIIYLSFIRHCTISLIIIILIINALFSIQLLVVLSPVSSCVLLSCLHIYSKSWCDDRLSEKNKINMAKLHLIGCGRKRSDMFAYIGHNSGNKVKQLLVTNKSNLSVCAWRQAPSSKRIMYCMLHKGQTYFYLYIT